MNWPKPKNMKEIHIKRLLKLAKHLRSDKRAHRRFDINTYNAGVWLGPGQCGTVGCAIGETPAVWPSLFRWEFRAVYSRRNSTGYTQGDHQRFFGLTSLQYNHLFLPAGYGWVDVSALVVAERIEHFCSGRHEIP